MTETRIARAQKQSSVEEAGDCFGLGRVTSRVYGAEA